MNQPELGEIANSEEIEKYYEDRELQVEGMIAEAEERFREKYKENLQNFLEFNRLSNLPPSIFNETITEPRLREEVLQNVGKAAEIITERWHLLAVLGDLSRATKRGVHQASEIKIDDLDSAVPLPLKKVIQLDLTELEPSIPRGEEEACQTLLNLLKVRNPFLRLRLDLAYRKGLHPLFDEKGTAILDFPTKIPQVSLRYRYRPDNRPPNLTLPKLFLLVKPF